MKGYKHFLIFLLISFALSVMIYSPSYGKESIGVIYPSLFITEELASFTQSVSYIKEKMRINTYVVNSKPEKDALISLYKFLKKKGVRKFIIKDELKELTPFYKEVSKKDLFFSFSSSTTLLHRKNIYRVVPSYTQMIIELKKYTEKRGSPPVYIIIEGLWDKDQKDIERVFSSYKGKWKVLPLKEIITPFGLTKKYSFEDSYIFIYTTSYKKGGILVQLIANKTKKFHIIIPGNLLSPSFLALTKGLTSHVLVESDIVFKEYEDGYKNFKKLLSSEDFLTSIYDFAKTKMLYESFSSKTKKILKTPEINIWELRYYER